MLDPDHAWTDSAHVTTITCVRSVDLGGVLGVLDVRTGPAHVRLQDLDPAPVQANERWEAPVQLAEAAGWIVVVEPGGTLCLEPTVRAGLLQLGAVLTIYYSINADAEFFFSEDDVARRFDPVTWPDGQLGQPLDQEAGLTFGASGGGNAHEQSVRLMERITGIDFTTPWVLTTPRATYSAPTYVP